MIRFKCSVGYLFLLVSSPAPCCGDTAVVNKLYMEKPRGRWKHPVILLAHSVVTMFWMMLWQNKNLVEHGACQDVRDTKEDDCIWWVLQRCVALRILQLLCVSQAYEAEWNKCWRTQILVCLRRKSASKGVEKLRTGAAKINPFFSLVKLFCGTKTTGSWCEFRI